MHAKLIRHELGHAIVGLISGLRVKRVHTPRPPDVPPEDLDAPAGFVEFHRGGDRRAKALALLGGPLAGGDPVPSWPIEPRTDDERKLARLVDDSDEITFLELPRDTRQIVAGSEFTRMHSLASELLAHPPHELTGEQLHHIREATTMGNTKWQAFPTKIAIKSGGEAPADRPFDDPDTMPPEYVGTAWDPTVADGSPVYAPPSNGNTSNGNKALDVAGVREASRQWMFRALTGTDAPPATPPRGTSFAADAPVRILTFDA